ncbi:hypothetical protein HanHA89_Chr06g0212211 [Helianthus annuus]|nr:hypothetical protein HanHA89_Chr06g0212211 [Helianthus annuus]
MVNAAHCIKHLNYHVISPPTSYLNRHIFFYRADCDTIRKTFFL